QDQVAQLFGSSGQAHRPRHRARERAAVVVALRCARAGPGHDHHARTQNGDRRGPVESRRAYLHHRDRLRDLLEGSRLAALHRRLNRKEAAMKTMMTLASAALCAAIAMSGGRARSEEVLLRAITYAPPNKVEDSMVIFKKWM